MRDVSASAMPRADVLAQLVERVEAGLGGELVVELGQLLGLDLAHRDGELGLLAGELVGPVVVGEGDRDRALLAADGALELLLEAGDEPAGAELDHLVAALAAGERHAVERAGEVHHHEVAALAPGASTVSSLAARSRRRSTSSAIASSETSGSRLPTSRPLYSPSSAFGRTPISIENFSGSPSLGQLAEVEVGLADGDDAGVVDRGAVPAAERLADRLVEHRLAADALDDDRRRRLAGAEAGHAHVAREQLGGLRHAALDLRGADLRLHAYA